jgi:hypothetical protein
MKYQPILREAFLFPIKNSPKTFSPQKIHSKDSSPLIRIEPVFFLRILEEIFLIWMNSRQHLDEKA